MISETCSVCRKSFDVIFRYQMEEKNGGFAFYCSQKCLESSQKGGDSGAVNCDACSKRFSPELVSQVFYLGGKRYNACSLDCRAQIQSEAKGARLGDLAGAKQLSRSPVKTPVVPLPAIPRASATLPVPAPSRPVHVRVETFVTTQSAPSAQTVTEPQVAPRLEIAESPPQTVSSATTGPLSAPAPTSQSGRSSGGRSSRSRRSGEPSRDEPPTRSSGFMAAIRDDLDAAPPTRDERPLSARTSSPNPPRAATASPTGSRNEIPGTIIPIVPPMKGDKRAADARPPAEAMGPRRIAVFNHKGGTGKTTTAVSIAAGLASKGKRVLLVDTDAQGNVSVSLGAGSERSLYHVLVMGLRVADSVKEVRPNLHLLPSNETLAAAELYLAGRQNRDRVLADRLSSAAADYDYVVLDCSPSLSLMNQNALVFADSVLVPVACDYLSLVGVRQVLKTVKNVNSLLHHPVQIWGVLPTFYDGRAKICNEAVSTLREHFGEKCLPPIRAAIKVKEAPSVGQTIFEYASGSNAAEDYGVIVDKIISAAAEGETETEAEGVMRDPKQLGQSARVTA